MNLKVLSVEFKVSHEKNAMCVSFQIEFTKFWEEIVVIFNEHKSNHKKMQIICCWINAHTHGRKQRIFLMWLLFFVRLVQGICYVFIYVYMFVQHIHYLNNLIFIKSF